jgi:hypothetical protein
VSVWLNLTRTLPLTLTPGMPTMATSPTALNAYFGIAIVPVLIE